MTSRNESADAAAHDALVASAHQAIASGDAARAVELLRQAVRVAPFRQDTRELLGMALEMALKSGANLAASSVSIAPPPAMQTASQAGLQSAPQPGMQPVITSSGMGASAALFSDPTIPPAISGAAPIGAPSAGIPSSNIGPTNTSGLGMGSAAPPARAFQRLQRETSLRLRLWFAGATVFLCFCAALAIILFTPVREYLARIQAQKDPKARELEKQQEEARTRMGQQNYQQAQEILTKAEKKAEKPEDKAAIAKQKAEALKAQAEALYKQDKYEEAIPLYLQALEIQKDSVDILKNLSRAHYYQAEKLRLNPNKKSPIVSKQKMDSSYKEAETYFRRVLELDEKNVEIAKLLALTYIRLNFSSKAIYKCYQILQWAPKSDEAKWAKEQLISRNKDPNKVPEALEQEARDDGAAGDSAKPKTNGDKSKAETPKAKVETGKAK